LIIDDTVAPRTAPIWKGAAATMATPDPVGHCKVTLFVRCGALKVPFAFRIYVTKAVAAPRAGFFTKLSWPSRCWPSSRPRRAAGAGVV